MTKRPAVEVDLKNRVVYFSLDLPSEYDSMSGSDDDAIELSQSFIESLREFQLGVTKFIAEELDRLNPTQADVDNVAKLLVKNIEFESKKQLLNKMRKPMSMNVLNRVLDQLVSENKIHVGKDKSITWIDASHNKKLLSSFKKAKRV